MSHHKSNIIYFPRYKYAQRLRQKAAARKLNQMAEEDFDAFLKRERIISLLKFTFIVGLILIGIGGIIGTMYLNKVFTIQQYGYIDNTIVKFFELF